MELYQLMERVRAGEDDTKISSELQRKFPGREFRVLAEAYWRTSGDAWNSILEGAILFGTGAFIWGSERKMPDFHDHYKGLVGLSGDDLMVYGYRDRDFYSRFFSLKSLKADLESPNDSYSILQISGAVYLKLILPSARKARLIQESISSACHETPEAKQCFIATAVYDSPSSPQVKMLQQWRRTRLERSVVGRCAVAVYYALSPPIAHCCRRSRILRRIARWLLDRIISRISSSIAKEGRCGV